MPSLGKYCDGWLVVCKASTDTAKVKELYSKPSTSVEVFKNLQSNQQRRRSAKSARHHAGLENNVRE